VREYVVDVSGASSWADFIAAFNKGFVHPVGGEWSGNLDALNDYLWWPDEHPYRLVIRGWAACAFAVNRHRTRDGRPVLDVVAEVFRENPQAEVVLAEPGPPRP
jgi:Barstar (barnase inhibitor)